MKKRTVFLVKQILMFAASVLVLTAVVFCVSHLAPGDPLVSYYGGRAERLGPDERAWATQRLGLDAPLPLQYIRWLSDALHGDFGESFRYKQDVLTVIAGRIGNTLLLGGLGLLLTFLLALGLGILCAWNEGRRLDRILCRLGTVSGCIPEFWLSLLLILVFSVLLRALPSSGAYTAGGARGIGDRAVHLILPLCAVVAGHLWYDAYLVRSRLLTELRAGYVLFARAKGLSRRRILLRHCLRGAMPSFLSLMALSVPHVLGGTYIVETVFSYPGIGSLTYESARYHDYPLLMALCILSGVTVMLCSAAADALGKRIDPRLRADTEVFRLEG